MRLVGEEPDEGVAVQAPHFVEARDDQTDARQGKVIIPSGSLALLIGFTASSRSLTIILAAVVALVLARSLVFLLWEHAGFDADQAIYGLMAKHLAEGRAFPMFAYSFYYMLAVQAWITAPLVAIFGASVAVLKVPVVVINIAIGCVLVWVLHRDAGLRPFTALVSSLFFLLAPPALAGALVETGGANPEPLLYVLLLWILRGRPLAFGLVFGLGFLHREFTLLGVTAIVGLALLDDRRITYDRIKTVALAGVGYMIVWQLVQTGFRVFDTIRPRRARHRAARRSRQQRSRDSPAGCVGCPTRSFPDLANCSAVFSAPRSAPTIAASRPMV